MKTKWLGITSMIMLLAGILLATCGFKHKDAAMAHSAEGEQAEFRHFYTAPPMPENITFMGDPVPLHRFDVRENLERELIVNSYFHSQTIRWIKLAPRFFTIIDPILEEMGIPSDFRYLAVAESGLNPRAVSPAGAAGFWQFMRSAASDYSLEVTSEVDERYHIAKSTRAACRYLLNGYKKYGDWALVAAAYNAGPAAIDRHRNLQKVDSYYDLLLSEETERYVYRILAIKLILEAPETYGFLIPEDEKYPLWKTREVEISTTISNLAEYSLAQGINYKTLKYYNPWLRGNVLTVRAGRKYVIELPVLNN